MGDITPITMADVAAHSAWQAQHDLKALAANVAALTRMVDELLLRVANLEREP